MIQFIRYVPMVAARGGRILVVCPPELQRLLQGVAGISQCLTPEDPLPPVDVHCLILSSLPFVFRTTEPGIPHSVPYLHAPDGDFEGWRKELGSGSNKIKVGLVWAGRPAHENDANRSLNLAKLAPLAQATGVTFYSLQKGESASQIRSAPAGMTLIDRTEELTDFADTAVFLANLDLLISVDTAVAHLAGALGKPVWTLLPKIPDWSWLLNRDDTPWYPTMRLFRQPAIGDWDSVIQQVITALTEFAGKITGH